ncbi:STAS domain-containing protein [Streptomyces chartreusis]|uniref:STAS domain-containing protein n=1 Tax=Streptomyces chartreusis TaxID=1969 RepID=UPI0033E923F2|nr:STAS domain-containing protein [Streptomyces chartreusis]WTA32710.1 STAS domain-containing protein [Streptomyces chartreusis]
MRHLVARREAPTGQEMGLMCPRPAPPEHHRAPELFDECRMVRARGHLDLTTVSLLTHALEEARTGNGRVFLIVDLREVSFTDGSILRPLCAAWDACRARQGWVRVVHSSTTIDLVLLDGGVLGRFPAHASAQDAWCGRTTAARGPVPALTSTRPTDAEAQ